MKSLKQYILEGLQRDELATLKLSANPKSAAGVALSFIENHAAKSDEYRTAKELSDAVIAEMLPLVGHGISKQTFARIKTALIKQKSKAGIIFYLTNLSLKGDGYGVN